VIEPGGEANESGEDGTARPAARPPP
jgi:hypothetical protein